MSSREDAIKRTGQMLLAGWKMLGISCPQCNAVLLAKDEVMKCPQCNLPVVMQDNVLGYEDDAAEEVTEIHSSSTIAATKSPLTNNNYTQNASLSDNMRTNTSDNLKPMTSYDDVIIPESYDEMKRDYDKTKSKRDAISSKLGEKMLSGWILLGEICPSESCHGTPLMRESHSTSTMLCVSCLKEYILNAYDEIEDINLTKKVIESSNAKSEDVVENKFNIDDIPILSFEKETDDDHISKLISTKLLQGWALLDKVCMKCNGAVPLMRDHNQQEYCVVCNVKYSPNQATLSVRKHDSEAKAATKSKRKVDETIYEDDSTDDVDWDDNSVYKQYLQTRVKQSGGKGPKKITKSESNSLAATGSGALDVCKLLEKKMMRVAEELVENDDLESCGLQVELVEKLSRSIKAVRGLIL